MKHMKTNFILLLLAICLISCKNDKKSDDVQAKTEEKLPETKPETAELSESPRHHEWVSLSSGNRELEAFVAYPETNQKAKAVMVIHENRGLNDWARLFADKLASQGYLVIAPDLISNTIEGKKRTTDFENSDAARDAIYKLKEEQVLADLDAAYTYIKNDPASTGEVAVVGFCWGGSQSFKYATHNSNIASAHVFYGTAPKDAKVFSEISAPVYAYYGENDNRVNATIAETEKMMADAGKQYEYEVYENAGHAFMRNGHQANAEEGNKKAHDAAWKRLLQLLK